MAPAPARADNMSEASSSNQRQLSLQEMHKQKWMDMQGPPRAGAFQGFFSSGPEDIGRALERGDVPKLALQRRNEMESEYANSAVGDPDFVEPSASSGHHVNHADGQMEVHSKAVANRGGIEQHAQTIPAAKKKTRRGLQRWEADSDSEHEFKKGIAVADEGPTADWDPFATHTLADAAEQGSRTRGPMPADMPWRRIGDSEQKLPEQVELKSFEEQVLGMRPDTPKSHRQAISNGPAGAKAGDEDATSDVDEQGVRDVREAAKRESQSLVELETFRMWQASPPARWIPGEEFGTLAGDHHGALAYLETWTLSDFDVEAEVMIEKGAYGGLLFRWSGDGIYSFCINLQKQQLEFQNPLGTEVLAFRKFSKDCWYRLRVRAADDTLMFFLDNEQIEQVVGYRQNDLVYYCDTSEKVCILDVSNAGTYTIKLEDEDEKSNVESLNLKPLPGCIGLFANQTRVSIRNVVMINLQEYVSSLRYQQQKMQEERVTLRLRERDTKAALKRRSMAARLIQEVGKLKNGLLSQRMEMYNQAEQQGREEQLREKKLLTWMTLLNVLAKINQEMSNPSKQDLRSKKFLEGLDEECPPPPPPPMRPPPSKEEEDLHYRYEAMKAKYAPQWNRAGGKVLGKEKFERVKNMQNDKDETGGFAFKQKKNIEEKCLEEAMNSMSERDHFNALKKAWCFEHELAEGDPESQKEEMERWYLEKVEKRKAKIAAKAVGKNM